MERNSKRNGGTNWWNETMKWNKLCWRRRCRAICIHELCADGMQKTREFFFLLLHVFFFFFLFFFFQSCYMGYSLHDYKLKNTHECTAQMLTSKPVYRESKCMWGCITWCISCTVIKPCVCVHACSQDLKLAVKQALELHAPSSLRSSEIQNFTTCSLFSLSLLLCWCCC